MHPPTLFWDRHSPSPKPHRLRRQATFAGAGKSRKSASKAEIEGINNKIKVIKRMAYGFRDEAYFFLKSRAAFPEFGEEPFSAAMRPHEMPKLGTLEP